MEVVVVTKSHSLLSTMDFCIHVNPPIYHCKPSIALAPWYLPWPASLLWRLAQPWPIFQKCDASRLRLRLSAIPLELLQLALWYLPWRPPGWPGQTRRCKSVLPSDWASTHPRSKTCIAPFVPKNCPTKKCWYVALKSVSGFWHKLQISPYLHRGHVNQMNEDRALWKHIQDICFKQRWHAQHEHEQNKKQNQVSAIKTNTGIAPHPPPIMQVYLQRPPKQRNTVFKAWLGKVEVSCTSTSMLPVSSLSLSLCWVWLLAVSLSVLWSLTQTIFNPGNVAELSKPAFYDDPLLFVRIDLLWSHQQMIKVIPPLCSPKFLELTICHTSQCPPSSCEVQGQQKQIPRWIHISINFQQIQLRFRCLKPLQEKSVSCLADSKAMTQEAAPQ